MPASPLRRHPLTLLLILANVGMYGAAGLLDTRAFESGDTSFLIDWGANVAPLTLGGEPWRLLSSMFLHIGLPHLAMNMLALWTLGRVLEPRLGSLRLGTVYLLSGLAGSLASAVWYRDDLLVSCGASGAILGLFGAALVQALARSGPAPLPLRDLLVSLALTFGAGALFSLDNAAHLGGLAAGALVAALACLGRNARGALRHAGAALGVAACAAMLLAAYRHYATPALHRQMAAAQLIVTYNHIGLGRPEGAPAGVVALEDCIAAVLSRPGDAAARLAGLQRRCASAQQDADAVRRIERRAAREFARCQALAARLAALHADPAARQAMQTVGRYCATHAGLYRAILGEPPAGFDLEQAAQSWAAHQQLMAALNAPAHAPPGLAAQAEAMRRILAEATPAALGVAAETGCPGGRCARFREP